MVEVVHAYIWATIWWVTIWHTGTSTSWVILNPGFHIVVSVVSVVSVVRKKIHRTDITLWKPPVQMLNTKEMTYTTCCTRWNEFYLSYDFFSYDRYDRYNDMETRLKDGAY